MTTKRTTKKTAAAPAPDPSTDTTGAAAPAPADDTTGAAGESDGLEPGTFVRYDDDGVPQLARILARSETGTLVLEPVGTITRHVVDVLAVEVTA